MWFNDETSLIYLTCNLRSINLKLSARLFIALQHIIPQHLLSKMMWKLTRCEYKWLLKLILPLFIRKFKVNMEEAKRPDWKSYASFNYFFTRELKESVREICTDEKINCISSGWCSESIRENQG